MKSRSRRWVSIANVCIYPRWQVFWGHSRRRIRWWHLFYYTRNSSSKNDENIKHMYHNGKDISINCLSWISIFGSIISKWKIEDSHLRDCQYNGVYCMHLYQTCDFIRLSKLPRFLVETIENHYVTKTISKKIELIFWNFASVNYVLFVTSTDKYWKFGVPAAHGFGAIAPWKSGGV